MINRMTRNLRNSGFAALEAILALVIVCAIVAIGWYVERSLHGINSTYTSATQSSNASSPKFSKVNNSKYLFVSQWGVELPLPSNISDAYYAVPIGISPDEDGKPSGIDLGLKSLNSKCGVVTSDANGQNNALGAIVRAYETDTDPVTGKSYQQLDPAGVTIGGYYYGYVSSFTNKSCTSNTKLQQVASSFTTAAKGITTRPTVEKISELGIQITVPSTIGDLTYKVISATQKNGQQGKFALFSTASLTAIDPGCGTNFGPLGSLGMVPGQYPTTAEDPYPALDYGVLLKQYPNFFITQGSPQAACSTNNTAEAMAGEDKGAFTSSYTTVKPLN